MVKFGLLGEKLSHSLSPKIHELLFRELDIEGTYSLLEIEKGNLATAFARLHENYGGVNVTIPYKTETIVSSYLKSIKSSADKLEICRCINT